MFLSPLSPPHASCAPRLCRELAALNTRLTTLGYQDGVEDGAEEAVQEGFDKGYAVGATAGWEAGSLYGGVAAVAAALARDVAKRNREGSAAVVAATRAGAVNSSVGGGEVASSSGVGAAPPQSQRLGSDDVERRPRDEERVTAAQSGELSALVEDLKRASLLGPDGPPVDKMEVLRRLRLLGPTEAAVAVCLGE